MELNKLIVERKVGAAESTLLSETQAMINQLMYKLQIEEHKMTLKWGVDRLVGLASPDLQSKWNSQRSKLEAAIIAGDVPLVEDLVAGSCRGLLAMERAAVAAGHVPYIPEFKEVAMDDGTIYRVVDDFADAEAISGVPHRVVVSVGELVRVLHQRRTETFKTPSREFGREYVASGRSLNESIPF